MVCEMSKILHPYDCCVLWILLDTWFGPFIHLLLSVFNQSVAWDKSVEEVELYPEDRDISLLVFEFLYLMIVCCGIWIPYKTWSDPLLRTLLLVFNRWVGGDSSVEAHFTLQYHREGRDAFEILYNFMIFCSSLRIPPETRSDPFIHLHHKFSIFQ